MNLQYEYELRIYKKEISFDRLQNDLNVWYLYKKINNAQFSDDKISNLSQQFINCKPYEHLAELFKLLKIYLSIPISSATGERSFSCLKLIKTYLRNSMLQDRLSNLSTISLNNDIVEEITFEEVIKIFASAQNFYFKIIIKFVLLMF